MAGSIVLIGGEPGIGKSTLVLQNILSIRGKRILYVSGEESAAFTCFAIFFKIIDGDETPPLLWQ
mgnify:CR=1 FL=1